MEWGLLLSLVGTALASPMQLVLFNDTYATETGARCLDGSVAGAYYAPGDPSRFVIYLEVCTS